MSAQATTTGTAVPWTAAKGTRPDTPRDQLDKAVAELVANRQRWVETKIGDRARLLDRLLLDCRAVGREQIEAACRAKGIDLADPRSGEEWLGGPLILHRNLRLLARSLRQIEEFGAPWIPGPVTVRPDGQTIARVYPDEGWDKLLFKNLVAEVWQEPGITPSSLRDNQAAIYRPGAERKGKVALVLGAGNVASIGPTDVLTKLFVEDQVCVLKMNPVNEYLGPFIERGFKALIDAGFLRVVYGGAEVGKHLCEHPDVEEIHITGSDKTHDAIVWGPPGAEREDRKRRKDPLLKKRITSELGNVSPVVIVPGPWSDDDVAFHATNIASQVQNNGSFNCNAAKLVVQHAGWDRRQPMIDAIRARLRSMPTRKAYYPGAEQRWQAFLNAHPEAEQLAAKSDGVVPWTLIPNVSPEKKDDVCFTSEAFCGVLGETALAASDPLDFLEKAVRFLTDVVWGTLNCCVLVHPRSLEDPAFARAFENAVARLRYGTVGINVWPAIGYGLVSPTWGAFPGHPLEDIQSGRGVVHNSFLFDRPQKSVIRAPFRIKPTPPWFFTHRRTHEVGAKLAEFEVAPSYWKIPSLAWSAMRP